MRVETIDRRLGRKVVTVGDCPPAPGDADAERAVIDFAMDAAGESRARSFGFNIEWRPAQLQAVVTIYTR